MTTALSPLSFAPTRARTAAAPWWWLLAGAGAGLVLGAVARGWMRLMSDDPDFTWAGTLAIVVSFGVAGLGVSLATVARSRPRRWLVALARTVGGVLALGIFGGAGMVMLPTVLLGTLALWRPWPRGLRIALALVAAAPVALIGRQAVVDAGLSARTVAGLVLFAATYLVVIGALGAVAAPHRSIPRTTTN